VPKTLHKVKIRLVLIN